MNFESICISNSISDISEDSILFCGDFCPIGRVEEQLSKIQFREFLGEFSTFIDKTVVSLANFEAPFRKSMSKRISKTGPSLSVNPEIAKNICDLGFTTFGMANNHILDYGNSSLLYTKQLLESSGISTFGAGSSKEEASKPFAFSLRNRTYAVLACAEREFSAAGDETPGAYCPSMEELIANIQVLSNTYDTVIVSYHAGNEYYRYPSPGLLSRCHKLVDAGAKAVICHHTHVPGAIEIYNLAPIIYSLGNFAFDRGLNRPSDWFTGIAANLSPDETGQLRLTLIPYHQFNKIPAIQLFSDDQNSKFIDFLKAQKEVLGDSKRLYSEWDRWCTKNREEYLGRILGMGRVAKKLFKIFRFPLLRLSGKKQLYMFNLINCPSHREVLLTLLEGNSKQDRE